MVISLASPFAFRASLYNALPIESAQALVNCMKEFTY
jgi:phosphoserine aminotransferase